MARKPNKETAAVNDTTETSAEGAAAETEVSQDNAAPGTQNLRIQGLSFVAPAPYNEGHVLTVAEAAAINQLFGENLRNNFASNVRKLVDAHNKVEGAVQIKDGTGLTDEQKAALAAEFAKYASEYKFSGVRRTSVTTDPVLVEAKRIAKALLDAALTAKGIKKSALAEGVYDKKIDEIIETRPAVMEEARRRVAANSEAAADLLSGLGA